MGKPFRNGAVTVTMRNPREGSAANVVQLQLLKRQPQPPSTAETDKARLEQQKIQENGPPNRQQNPSVYTILSIAKFNLEYLFMWDLKKIIQSL